MRIETLRMARAWLVGSRGANYYIPLVARDAGDPQPPLIQAWDADLAVFEETTHDCVANREPPPALPALYLMCEGTVDMDGNPTPDGQIQETSAPLTLSARYITSDGDPKTAKRDGEYTLRALRRSLREWMKESNYDTYRVRNSICVISMANATSYLPITEEIGNCFSAGALLFNLNVRDASPSF